MRIKKFKTKVAKDVASTSKTNLVKTTIKKSPIKNLGKYAYAAKLPTGAKIGKPLKRKF